jgi:hypothetical protein
LDTAAGTFDLTLGGGHRYTEKGDERQKNAAGASSGLAPVTSNRIHLKTSFQVKEISERLGLTDDLELTCLR